MKKKGVNSRGGEGEGKETVGKDRRGRENGPKKQTVREMKEGAGRQEERIREK